MANLYFTKEHEWVLVKGNLAYIGITDYAAEKLGDIVFVELPEVDDEIEAGDACGVIESVKSASDIFSPVTGRVAEINEDLEDSPENINEDAMDCFVYAVEMTDPSELDELMDETEYKDFIGEE
ncbi:glycine cleavage system protein GcvH [Guggenheimella bovis]